MSTIAKPKKFEDAVRSGYYSQNPYDWKTEKAAAREHYNEMSGEFEGDALDYLRKNGVPEKYVRKVFAFAYQEGHANGYHEVLTYMDMMLEIFKP